MSAIVGLYHLNGRPVDRAEMERMIECLAHRGPDGSGVWHDKAIGLGHRMLWTTPESLQETLPLVDTAGEQVLTADARIDNRDELIAELGVTAGPSGQISDSELILRAYKRWGEGCAEKLVGDFAFAIWDRKEQTLFCARDHFGVKPFYYYYRSDRLFAFATEIKALLCLPEIPCRLNEARIADYLEVVLLREDKTITFYQDIMRLPPGHCLTVSRDTAKIRAYWALDPSRELRLGSDEEYAEAFREVFTEAVRCRLRSIYPVGAMLSGGLDSSSIVCTARHLLEERGRPRLHTFSAVFDDLPECDERSFINEVLAQGGVEPHYVHADRLNPLAELERVLWHQDEAFYAPNLYMHWGLYQVAQEQRVRVLLDGFDGDTTVAHGVGRLTELARAWRCSALAVEVAGLSRNFKVAAWRILWRRVAPALAPELLRTVWHRLRGCDTPQWSAIINPDFARRINLTERVAAVKSKWGKPPQTAREEHWRELSDALNPYVLEVADRAAAAHRISPGFPFFDKRLAEFCLALPADQKLHRGWTRVVMRRAMEKRLPEKVQWRGGKSNLSPMLIHALLAFNREIVEEVILGKTGHIEAYVNIPVLRQAYRRYAAGWATNIARVDEMDVLKVWTVVVLAVWLRQANVCS